jgi:hypothetical protein
MDSYQLITKLANNCSWAKIKLVYEYSSTKIFYPLSTIHYPLSTIHYPLSTIHYPQGLADESK